jgi:hypothetical protein
MRDRMPRLLEMTPDGEFVPQRAGPAWPLRLGVGAALVAVAAAALTVAALFLWVASVLLPVALVAGAVAYGAFRYQAWRARH